MKRVFEGVAWVLPRSGLTTAQVRRDMPLAGGIRVLVAILHSKISCVVENDRGASPW
jgi:hypothetical protein